MGMSFVAAEARTPSQVHKCRDPATSQPVWKRMHNLRQGWASPYCSSCPPPLSFPYRGRHSESSSLSPNCLHPVFLHQHPSCLSNYVHIWRRGSSSQLCLQWLYLQNTERVLSLWWTFSWSYPSSLLPQRPSTSSSVAAAAPPPVSLWSTQHLWFHHDLLHV